MNKLKTKLYIDYDCVLVNFMDAYINYMNSKYNLHIENEDITTYDYMRMHYSLGKNFWEIGTEYDKAQPFPGAIEFFNSIVELFDYVTIVTTTRVDLVQIKENHIWTYFDNNYQIKHVSSGVEKYIHTFDGIFIDDFILSVLNHSYVNKSPGIIFNYEEKYHHANVKLNNKSLAEDIYKIKADNLYYATNYMQLYQLLRELINENI
jgi:5'(3')-deoxyribonucleotidase